MLIEAPIDRIDADVALMQEIMRRASRIVLNATADGTHELRTDARSSGSPIDTPTNGGRRCGTTCSNSWPSIGNRPVQSEGMMNNWTTRRLRELETVAPVNKKQADSPFVKVPLWWIEDGGQSHDVPQRWC